MPGGEAHGAMRTSPHLARSVRRSGGGGAGVRRLREPRQGTCFPGQENLGYRGRGGKWGCMRRADRRREVGGPRGAGEAGRARAKGDNEMDRWHQSGALPGLRTSPGLSYLFNRRPPPALLRSRGLTRRVVSEPPVAGEGSMSPLPRPSRPHREGEAGQALRQIRAVQGPPGLPAGPPVWRELR